MIQKEGHPITFVDVDIDEVNTQTGAIEAIYDAKLTGIIVRRAFPLDLLKTSTAHLASPELAARWTAPNAGMTGGEIRVIGDAATPTFTALRGPSHERYTQSTARHEQNAQAVFGTSERPLQLAQTLLSSLFDGRPARPARFEDGSNWSPYNFRALDPEEQIYSHHDNHYGLSIYDHLNPELDRSGLLSWFITLNAPQSGGNLIVYGLWGSDPNPPMLPTRFIDTAALEQRFIKHTCDLKTGDLVIFDAGRHVHRVTPVKGTHSRLTLGGFMTLDSARSRVAFWS